MKRSSFFRNEGKVVVLVHLIICFWLMIYSNKEKPRGHFFVLNIPLSFFIPLNIDIVTSRIVIAMSNFFSFT